MFINIPIMPKRWNPTPNWLNVFQHPPASGWYRARILGKEFEAFCVNSSTWYKADYGSNGMKTQGERLNITHLQYLSDGR